MKLKLTFLLLLMIYAFSTFGQVSNLSVVSGTADNGLPAHIISWKDASNQTREAVMVDQRPGGAGYLRQFTYKVAGADRICRGTGANGHMGDGYIQNHTIYGGDNSSHGTAGTTTVILSGEDHVILQYSMPGYKIDGKVVPTTVQWFFATGRDYPIFSVTQDARGTTGNIGADSRSPYGDMHYDGSNPANGAYGGDLIGGISMGDTHKFVSVTNNTTTESTKLTSGSGWRYDELNSIPYAMEWTKNVDAEQGHVLTQPITVKDMGRTGSPALTNIQKLNGPMIGDEQYPYQICAYGILDANGGVTKRLTWGTAWGYPGGFDEWSGLNVNEFTRHSDGVRTNGMLLAYSVFDVFGTHTGGYKNGAVGKTITQMEHMQQAVLTAAVGTVATSGPAGVGLAVVPANNVTYLPAGYNHIYAAWEMNAASNKITATLTPANSMSIDNPVFLVNNYTKTTLDNVCINSIPAVEGVDYFSSIDVVNKKLWLTVNASVSSAFYIQVNNALCTTVLPVLELQFSAKLVQEIPVLSWSLAQLQNVTSFEIERSADGIMFSKIATIPVRNTTVANDYEFKDLGNLQPENYYRLRLVKQNGSSSFTNIILLKVNTANVFSISPNPVKGIAKLVFYKAEPGNFIIRIMAHDGRIVNESKGRYGAGKNEQEINLGEYPAGTYLLSLISGSGIQTIKMVKQQ